MVSLRCCQGLHLLILEKSYNLEYLNLVGECCDIRR